MIISYSWYILRLKKRNHYGKLLPATHNLVMWILFKANAKNSNTNFDFVSQYRKSRK